MIKAVRLLCIGNIEVVYNNRVIKVQYIGYDIYITDK
jgi:hypothetical protein